MKKKILLVDDQLAFVNAIRRNVNEDEQNSISVSAFGIDIGEIKDDNIGESFLNYLKEHKDDYIADVIFCDYQLENGRTAIDILKLTEEIPALPPIVVMTANNHRDEQEARLSLKYGAKGYIIKSAEYFDTGEIRNTFINELFRTTYRVYIEYSQLLAYTIVNEFQHNFTLDFKSINEMSNAFVQIMNRYYPYYKIFIIHNDNNLNFNTTNINQEKLLESNKGLIKTIKEGDRLYGIVYLYPNDEKLFDREHIKDLEYILNSFSTNWKIFNLKLELEIKDKQFRKSYKKMEDELDRLHSNLSDISHTYKDYIEIKQKIKNLRESNMSDDELFKYIGDFTFGLKYIFSIGALKNPEKIDGKVPILNLFDKNRIYLKNIQGFIDAVPRLLNDASDTSFVIDVSGTTNLEIAKFKPIDIESIFFEYIFNAIKQNKSYGSNVNNSRKKVTIKVVLSNEAIYIANDGYPVDADTKQKIFETGISVNSEHPRDDEGVVKKAGLGIGLSKCKAYLNSVGWETKLVENVDIEALKDCTVIFKFSVKEK